VDSRGERLRLIHVKEVAGVEGHGPRARSASDPEVPRPEVPQSRATTQPAEFESPDDAGHGGGTQPGASCQAGRRLRRDEAIFADNMETI
jgi:hypothetical protein